MPVFQSIFCPTAMSACSFFWLSMLAQLMYLYMKGTFNEHLFYFSYIRCLSHYQDAMERAYLKYLLSCERQSFHFIPFLPLPLLPYMSSIPHDNGSSSVCKPVKLVDLVCRDVGNGCCLPGGCDEQDMISSSI